VESVFGEVKTSATFEQLTKSRTRIPVLVYERVKIGQYFRFFARYKRKLVFAGKLEVLRILLIGLTGYWYVIGTKYHSNILDGLLSILATAKLDDRMYRINDWGQRKGRLLVYVTKDRGR
jgi:hypothetical protein